MVPLNFFCPKAACNPTRKINKQVKKKIKKTKISAAHHGYEAKNRCPGAMGSFL
jgi:hypothetical protein